MLNMVQFYCYSLAFIVKIDRRQKLIILNLNCYMYLLSVQEVFTHFI